MNEPIQTSLGRLSDTEWTMLSNRWARGVDWYVQKIGSQWAPADVFGKFPLFKTKRAAEEAASKLFLAESLHRAWKRGQS